MNSSLFQPDWFWITFIFVICLGAALEVWSHNKNNHGYFSDALILAALMGFAKYTIIRGW